MIQSNHMIKKLVLTNPKVGKSEKVISYDKK